MNRLIFVAAFTGTALLPVTTTAQSEAASEEVLFRLQNQWAQARIHADMGFLEKFYASEFTVGLLNGGEASRSEDLEKFSSGDLKPTAIEDSEMKVHIYGSAAMVTGKEHLAGSYKGHTGQFDLTFTNVFVFRDGRWQIVRHQAAQIQKR